MQEKKKKIATTHKLITKRKQANCMAFIEKYVRKKEDHVPWGFGLSPVHHTKQGSCYN